MFGDMGHGTILFLVGLLLVLFNDKLKGTALEAAGQGRYLLFLMGISAFYNGMIYNEAFAIPIDLYGSCYSKTPAQITPLNKLYYYPRIKFDCVYSFGIDPIWASST